MDSATRPQIGLKIRKVFEDWNRKGVKYALLRGWDGVEILGSDIDVLIHQSSFYQASAILEKWGFIRVKRHWALFDFLARECYWDQFGNSKRYRFHLSNQILFGKPARIVRLPIESAILGYAEMNQHTGAVEPLPGCTHLVALFRAIIDKPERINSVSIDINQIEQCFENQPEELRSLVSWSHERVRLYREGKISTAALRAEVVLRFKELSDFRYWLRRIQYAISRRVLYANSTLRRLL